MKVFTKLRLVLVMLKSSGRIRTGRDCALLVNFTLKDFFFHNSSADSPLAEPSETIISPWI